MLSKAAFTVFVQNIVKTVKNIYFFTNYICIKCTLKFKISVTNPSIYFNLLTVVLEPLCHWNQCRNSQRTQCLCPNE